MASHDGIKPQQGTRKLSFQPHKLTAAQRRHIEATYTAQIDQLSSQLATLQADSIRLKNRGMLLECQLAIKDDQLAEASGHVQMFDWGPSLARVDITPSGRPTLNGQQFATNVVNNMPYMNEDVQHLYDARDAGMANMSQLVTWLDATDCPVERQKITQQIYQMHGMMLTSAVAVASKDPILLRKLAIRWHHHQPHLDRIDGHVLHALRPIVDAFAFKPIEIIDLMHMRSTYIRRFNSLLAGRRSLTAAMHQCAMRQALTVSLTERNAACEGGGRLYACAADDHQAPQHVSPTTDMQFINSLVTKYLFPRSVAGARKMQQCLPDFPDDLIFLTAVGIYAGYVDVSGRPIRALPPLHDEQQQVAPGGGAVSATCQFVQAIADIVEEEQAPLAVLATASAMCEPMPPKAMPAGV